MEHAAARRVRAPRPATQPADGDIDFHAMADAAPTGFFETDKAGIGRYVNQAWEAITGVSAGDALGRSWETIVHPDDWQELPVDGGRFRLRSDGSDRWVEGRLAPLVSG